MAFLYATTVSLIKLIFYIKDKKAVDLKLPHRISRNQRFSRYLSPETYECNNNCTALSKQSSKGVL